MPSFQRDENRLTVSVHLPRALMRGIAHGTSNSASRGISQDAPPAEPFASSPGLAEGEGQAALRRRAAALVQRQGAASASLLQRHLRIGYRQATRLLAELEAEDQGAISTD